MEEQTYKAIRLEKFKGQMNYGDAPFKALTATQVLVRMKYATIHPADLAFLEGKYGLIQPSDFPLTPGLEGSGTIEKVGDNANNHLIGKKCAIASNSNQASFCGTWGQYCVKELSTLVVPDEDIGLKELCFLTANPATAVVFFKHVQRAKSPAVCLNGGSSAFGRIFTAYCNFKGVKVINVVRKKEYFDEIKQLGAEIMVSTSDSDWEDQLKAASAKLDVKIAFECVGGDKTGKFIGAMPDNCDVVHFGNLELKRLEGIQTEDLIERNITIRGLNVGVEMMESSQEELVSIYKEIVDNYRKCDLSTKVSKEFKLSEIEQAFNYWLPNMNKGKILLNCD